MSNKYLIVIVEDEYNISSFVSAVLQANGFDTMVARNGAEAIILITSHCPDLVLLDLGLPDMDGQGIIENVRGWSNVPIIVVSARTRERDKVMALESGADDYITKPFGIMELLSRVKAVLRRAGGTGSAAAEQYIVANLVLDAPKHKVTVGEKDVELTYKEFELLLCMLQNRDIVLTREQLMERVWGYQFAGESRTVDAHVKTLRQKLEQAGCANIIHTVRGVGYKISL